MIDVRNIMVGIVEEVEKDQHGTFAKFLVEEGIDAQYTMASTPQQNGIA